MVQIGAYELHAIDAGRLRLDGGGMFGRIPKPLWERKIEADARNRILMAMRCLLLVGEGRVILVDTGLGPTYTDKFADIYGVDQETTELHRSLEEAGYAAEDVTDVLLTHLHFDHGGGCTRGSGKKAELEFPNATHYVQDRQWAWAHDSEVLDRASFLEDNLRPLEQSRQLVLLDGPGSPFPGLELLVVDGHTRGQQLLKIKGPDRTLLYAADLFPTTAHLPPRWNMAFDVAEMETLREKTDVLEQAVEEGWTLFFEHDPETEIAEVERTDRAYQPLRPRSLDALTESSA